MTNIQDDQLISQYSDDNSSAVSNGEPVISNDEVAEPEQPVISNDEVAEPEQPAAKPKPSRADVDELISQLDALHQEIAAKAVVPEAPAADTPAVADLPAVEKTPTMEVQTDKAQVEEENKVEKLTAPPVTPLIESSDDPQLA
ncbi:MAG: hypothetical protein GX559_03320, partial [Candidatus Pacebacteria bacterium]|nr:hypothetical protein [Candidatus Paceibacterota bacterium]